MPFNFSEVDFSDLCHCWLFENTCYVLLSQSSCNSASDALLSFLQDKVYSSVLQQCYSMYKVGLTLGAQGLLQDRSMRYFSHT